MKTEHGDLSNDDAGRRALAFLLAPAVAPLLQLPWLLGIRPLGWLVTALAISTVTAYLGTLAFGAAAYRLLTLPGLGGALTATGSGFVSGALMWLVFLALFVFSLGQGLAGVQSAFTDASSLRGALWPGGISGAAVGLIFWMIAHKRH